MSAVKILITIVNRGMAENVSAFLNRKYPQVSFLAMGEGTASSEIMDLLGLDSAEKDVVLSLVGEHEMQAMLSEISGKKFMKSAGAGIAFTIALNGIGSLMHAALTHDAPEDKEDKVENNKNNDAFSVVVAITDPGYSDQIMDLARGAGARGGTVIYSRGIGHDDAGKFLGINIQSEKELVLILTPAEGRVEIMKAINDGFGIRKDAKAIVLSLPVEDMVQVS